MFDKSQVINEHIWNSPNNKGRQKQFFENFANTGCSFVSVLHNIDGRFISFVLLKQINPITNCLEYKICCKEQIDLHKINNKMS